MLKDISRTRAIGAWVALIIVIMAVSIVAGAQITVGTGALWLVACLVPPGVLLLLWHGVPPVTIAQVLHPNQGQSKDDRP